MGIPRNNLLAIEMYSFGRDFFFQDLLQDNYNVQYTYTAVQYLWQWGSMAFFSGKAPPSDITVLVLFFSLEIKEKPTTPHDADTTVSSLKT